MAHCKPCALILSELCRRHSEVCDLADAYEHNAIDDAELVAALKRIVTREEIAQVRCSLYQAGKLTDEEAGDLSTCTRRVGAP